MKKRNEKRAEAAREIMKVFKDQKPKEESPAPTPVPAVETNDSALADIRAILELMLENDQKRMELLEKQNSLLESILSKTKEPVRAEAQAPTPESFSGSFRYYEKAKNFYMKIPIQTFREIGESDPWISFIDGKLVISRNFTNHPSSRRLKVGKTSARWFSFTTSIKGIADFDGKELVQEVHPGSIVIRRAPSA